MGTPVLVMVPVVTRRRKVHVVAEQLGCRVAKPHSLSSWTVHPFGKTLLVVSKTFRLYLTNELKK